MFHTFVKQKFNSKLKIPLDIKSVKQNIIKMEQKPANNGWIHQDWMFSSIVMEISEEDFIAPRHLWWPTQECGKLINHNYDFMSVMAQD